MIEAKVLSPIIHDGIAYAKDEIFKGEKAVVTELVKLGALLDPNAKAETPVNADDVQKEAKKVLADAKAEAAKIKAEAEKLLADAKAKLEAEAKKSEGSKGTK